jgi:hypothetical protein
MGQSARIRLRAARAVIAPAFALLGAQPAAAADAAHPSVVELYQSQGCSSCPPANANLLRLIDRPDVLALSFEVTYWDHLGWKDTFADPAFTARQAAYAPRLGHGEVFTPQVVVNGRADVVGARPGEIESLIARADRGASGPFVRIEGGRVTVGAGPGAPAAVWLVRYDPRLIEVAVTAGENDGKTLPHRNVVRSLTRLGTWTGTSLALALPKAPPGPLRTAVLVQSGRGGPIIAAARPRLEGASGPGG